jgi:hypothetical protein
VDVLGEDEAGEATEAREEPTHPVQQLLSLGTNLAAYYALPAPAAARRSTRVRKQSTRLKEAQLSMQTGAQQGGSEGDNVQVTAGVLQLCCRLHRLSTHPLAHPAAGAPIHCCRPRASDRHWVPGQLQSTAHLGRECRESWAGADVQDLVGGRGTSPLPPQSCITYCCNRPCRSCSTSSLHLSMLLLPAGLAT